MSAFNVVRFRVKSGSEQRFLDAHRAMRPELKGFISGSMIKTGDRTYCLVVEWRSFQSIVAARPTMIGMLDSMRDMLEDLGGGLGVTDPVSGEVVLRLKTAAVKRPAAAKRKSKPARKAGRAAKKRRR
jgi:hypothetical protein